MYKAIYADGFCYGTVKVPENVPGEFIPKETAMHINALIDALPEPTETTIFMLSDTLEVVGIPKNADVDDAQAFQFLFGGDT